MGFLSGLADLLSAQRRREKTEFCSMTAEAAKAGNPKAQEVYADMFFSGQGVPKDARQGIHWLRAAAEQNVVRAQMNLALRYETGKDVNRDMEEAIKWFKRAA